MAEQRDGTRIILIIIILVSASVLAVWGINIMAGGGITGITGAAIAESGTGLTSSTMVPVAALCVLLGSIYTLTRLNKD